MVGRPNRVFLGGKHRSATTALHTGCHHEDTHPSDSSSQKRCLLCVNTGWEGRLLRCERGGCSPFRKRCEAPGLGGDYTRRYLADLREHGGKPLLHRAPLRTESANRTIDTDRRARVDIYMDTKLSASVTGWEASDPEGRGGK